MKKIIIPLLVATMAFGLVGCGNNATTETPSTQTPPVVEEVKPAVEVSMQNIVDTMMHTYGETYLPGMEIDQEIFNSLIGIDASEASEYYSEFYAGMPMMSTHVDKLFIVKTSDTNKMSEVFTNYMTTQIEDAMQYPMNLSKLENYNIVVHDDYVILFILGGYTDEMVEDDGSKTPEELDAAQEAINVAYYKEQSEIGINALNFKLEILK